MLDRNSRPCRTAALQSSISSPNLASGHFPLWPYFLTSPHLFGHTSSSHLATPPHLIHLATPLHLIHLATPPHLIHLATPPHLVHLATPPHPTWSHLLTTFDHTTSPHPFGQTSSPLLATYTLIGQTSSSHNLTSPTWPHLLTPPWPHHVLI
jgi:hypothetical protein